MINCCHHSIENKDYLAGYMLISSLALITYFSQSYTINNKNKI